MVEWWRGSLEAEGVELLEVLGKLAPPEGMTQQQQELTWARRYTLNSPHTHQPQTPFQSRRPTCSGSFLSKLQRAFKHVYGALPHAVVSSSRVVALRQQQESEGRLWRAEQELACRSNSSRGSKYAKCCAAQN